MLLKRKLFSYSDFCVRYGFLHPFKTNIGTMTFQDIMVSYTMKVIESGLDIAWEKQTYFDIKFKFRTSAENSFRILELRYFIGVWWIFGGGVVLSVFVFYIEMSMQKIYNLRSVLKIQLPTLKNKK